MRNRYLFSVVAVLILLCASTIPTWSAEPWEQYDFDGETVTLYVWNPDQFVDGRERAHFEWVEEAFNAKIVFDRTNSHNRDGTPFTAHVANLILSGEPNFMVMALNWEMEMAVLQNLLLPLDDALDDAYYDSIHPIISVPLREATRVLGRTYGFVHGVGTAIPQGGPTITWNKSLFEREGLPDLYELVDAGEWTWDVFRDIATRATKDTSGDGEIDQFGLVSLNRRFPFVTGWAKSNNAELTVVQEGRVEFAFDDPKAIDAILFRRDLDEMGLVGPTWRLFDEGKAAMLEAGNWVYGYDWFHGMPDDYGLVPLPMGPEGTDYISMNHQFWTMMLPVNAENPRALIELYNALYQITDPYRSIEEWDEELTNQWMMRISDLRTWETMNWLAENNDQMTFRGLLVDAGVETLINEIMTSDANPASAIAESKQAIQAHLDEALGQ